LVILSTLPSSISKEKALHQGFETLCNTMKYTSGSEGLFEVDLIGFKPDFVKRNCKTLQI
jgi:hypothetical protein